ncbi:hypothetical protein [Alkaliphilus peptidifermentans]|uniref:Uncharacterized protein n=1 Tax=Alkaliphilus peptidifermentans DSM 18978 TaxID=1120976 RepID=A0A1G5K8E1_9FIRM|nr:hypothetical protein [Alkaliphilus peptidifermentans]SCY96288.1 hypothetical protein SAMN03080606_03264 [Alkaliphilus peptidifermentans DSM 18978]
MLSNKHIMVYYHCYYIVEDASEGSPELFYQYWDEIRKLLKHSNSYHRDIGLTVLANLTKVDVENKMADTIESYLQILNDKKFMTAVYCVKSCGKIMVNKPELMDLIIERLLELYESCRYSEKQQALMMSDIIETFNMIFDKYHNLNLLFDFARKNLNSISPKTRKIAKEFLSKQK